VEALVRLVSPDHVRELTELMDTAFSPATAAWHLDSDGTWTRHHRRADGTELTDLQEQLIKLKTRRRTDVD
jgi:polyphosphate kinase